MKRKSCSKCYRVLSLSGFNLNKNAKDGHASQCKDCAKASVKEYLKTPRGIAIQAWNSMNKRVARQPEYAGIEVRMTRDEFVAWAIPEYASYLSAGHSQRPSVDRIDPTLHYSIDNIRIIGLTDNVRRARRNKNVLAPEGQCWCSHCKRYLDKGDFGKNRKQWNGINTICKACRISKTVHRPNPRYKLGLGPPGTRWCSKCKSYLPADQFYACKMHGYQSSCKTCQNSRPYVRKKPYVTGKRRSPS